MKHSTLTSVDRVSLYILMWFVLVFLVYLAMIAWVIYEFMHQPTEPSTRILLPGYIAHRLHRTKQVQFFVTKVFPR